jgi:hypothetical protein
MISVLLAKNWCPRSFVRIQFYFQPLTYLVEIVFAISNTQLVQSGTFSLVLVASFSSILYHTLKFRYRFLCHLTIDNILDHSYCCKVTAAELLLPIIILFKALLIAVV